MKCVLCGSSGYMGLNAFDCDRVGCKNYRRGPAAQPGTKVDYFSKTTSTPLPPPVNYGPIVFPSSRASSAAPPNFDPGDWDPDPNSASYTHYVTGQRISYAQYTLWALRFPGDMEKARLRQKVRTQDLLVRDANERLLKIGRAAGFTPQGPTFPWDTLVDHVIKKLP